MPTEIKVPRKPIEQPDPATTQVGQKRMRQGDTYDPAPINSEFDYVHERLNQINNKLSALAQLTGLSAQIDQLAATVGELSAGGSEEGGQTITEATVQQAGNQARGIPNLQNDGFGEPASNAAIQNAVNQLRAAVAVLSST